VGNTRSIAAFLSRMNLVLGQIYSLALSFVAVFLILLVWFRSLVQALIGVIPAFLNAKGGRARRGASPLTQLDGPSMAMTAALSPQSSFFEQGG
jgi:hypothetical protein